MAPPPPSYESAVPRKAWPLVVPYVKLQDLYSLCLASQEFHRLFAPQLWRDPASFFGTSSDDIYLSITRFKRLLFRARPEVRRLTHILHIPPARPEFYGGPQRGWLKDILDRLPSLQALVVSNLSFFDHQALQKTHKAKEIHCDEDTKYGLRLLVASECENTTGPSLANALRHFPELVYLDLSSAHGSRSVLLEIGSLTHLRVLLLRNCGLRDTDIAALSLPSRLRSLDVSDNYLTENGISSLITSLPASSKPVVNGGNETRSNFRSSSNQRPSLQGYVYHKLTDNLDGHMYLEDSLPSGFSELYVAGNFMTVDELSKGLYYPSIEYLDCGSLNCSQRPLDLLSPASPGADRRRFSTAEIDKLSPVVFADAFRNIQSLRIHHSVITSHPFYGNDVPAANQCFELHGEDLRYELDSAELIFELDDTSVNHTPEAENLFEDEVSVVSPTDTHFTCESPDDVGPALHLPTALPGKDQSRVFESPITDNARKSLPNNMSTPSKPMAGFPSHLLTQQFPSRSADNQLTIIPPPTSAPAGPERFVYKHRPGQAEQWNDAGNNGSKGSTPREIIDEVLQRRHRTEARERHPGRFKPSMLPNLKTLVLTDVPSSTRRKVVAESLALFIQECAEEEELARLEKFAQQTKSGNMLNEGSMIKLELLVLEMSSAPDPIAPRPLRVNRFTKSSTEDYDSEMLSEASESDFSFFGEDDGGLLVGAGRIDPPMRVDDGIIVNDNARCNFTEIEHSVDVVSELVSFRRERKAKHESTMKCGDCPINAALMGHWRGEIQVIRASFGT